VAKVGDRFVSTPVIENCEPNFRFGWEAVIRSSRLNDASAPTMDRQNNLSALCAPPPSSRERAPLCRGGLAWTKFAESGNLSLNKAAILSGGCRLILFVERAGEVCHG